MKTLRFTSVIGRLCLISIAFLPTLATVRAGSATWSPNPTSSDWNTAVNWTPPTVPNGPTDVATFVTSSITDLSLSAGIALDSVVFDPGASAFRISAPAFAPLIFFGTGVTNNSTSVQNFIVQSDAASEIGYLSFQGSASAGNLTSYIVMGATEGQLGYATLEFAGNSTAGNGTFVNQGSVVHSGLGSGIISFFSNATAGAGNFKNQAGAVRSAPGAQINFYDQTSAGSATFVNNGAGDRAHGASITFNGSATAGSASFTNNGATNEHGTQGIILFMMTRPPKAPALLTTAGFPAGSVVTSNSMARLTQGAPPFPSTAARSGGQAAAVSSFGIALPALMQPLGSTAGQRHKLAGGPSCSG